MNCEHGTVTNRIGTVNGERWTINAERWTMNAERGTENAERRTVNVWRGTKWSVLLKINFYKAMKKNNQAKQTKRDIKGFRVDKSLNGWLRLKGRNFYFLFYSVVDRDWVRVMTQKKSLVLTRNLSDPVFFFSHDPKLKWPGHCDPMTHGLFFWKIFLKESGLTDGFKLRFRNRRVS